MKKVFIILFVAVLYLNSCSQKTFQKIVFETSAGNMVIQLYDETPLHSENFTKLVNEGYYNNLLFHRVIKNFMIQAGDPNSKAAKPGEMLGMGGPGYTVPAEFVKKYYHKQGALAAARQPDQMNPEKESSGSQFYIVHGKTYSDAELDAFVQRGMHIPFTAEQIDVYKNSGGTPHLDYEYTVFGEIIEGLEILDYIAANPVDRNNRPISDIRIIKAYTIK